jgi:DNA (cytosine-5)-methyltransferase 1
MQPILSFTKAKRAQTNEDYETWIAGGVVPTLNAMDNNGEAFATVLIIDGTRVNDVRVYEDGIVPTVISRYGTGGGNVPMVFPIDDARELEKHQNGTGIGAEGAPAYTLDRQQAPAVVITDEPLVMRDREGKPGGGKGPLISDTAFTLATSNFHTLFQPKIVAPTLSASNNPSRSPQSSEITAQVDAMVRETGVVRRLTPMECERLQGFPDDWTDGQADSNRYKQMGNAVAVPVVEWIISRMVADDE